MIKLVSFGMSCILLGCLVLLGIQLGGVSARDWPVYPNYYSNRSKVAIPDSYCRAKFPFCPEGVNHVPTFADADTIEVLAMKKPVWQFITGDILGKFGIWHDALGIRSKSTGLNFTVEWYELFEILNSTFPHILENRTSPLWCNQGAACYYKGIVDKLWLSNGSITKVAELTGKQFAQWVNWMKLDNDTGPFYETWRVKEGNKQSDQEWFVPFDCASFIQRSFQEMKKLGAEFNPDVKLNHSFITLYSAKPTFLGNETDIFGPNNQNSTIATTLMKWYSNFQPHHKNLEEWIYSIIEIISTFEFEKEFYIYYNKAYWQLSLQKPIISITYEYVALP